MPDPVFIAGRKVSSDGVQYIANLIWDVNTLAWVPLTVATPEGVAANVSVSNWPDTQIVSISPGRSLDPEGPISASVSGTSAQILAANSIRMGLVFVNLSGNNISFGLGVTAELNKGITLTPYGSWVMDENTLYNGVINAIASGDASALSIQEFSE